MNNQADVFHKLHHQPTPLILPNAWDAASARIFEDLGATAIATTSAGVAWSQGYPDGRIMPPQVQAQLAANIVRVIKVPLSVDFENGYSDNPNDVAENIKPLLDAGVAGINIEDGTDTSELLAAKIEAIRKAADSYGINLFINARTDVYLAGLAEPHQRIREVAERAGLYAAAGASGLFVPVLADTNEISEIVSLTTLPLNVMLVPGLPGAEELVALGVKRLSAGGNIPLAIWHRAAALAEKFLKGGDIISLGADQMAYGKMQELFQ